MLIYSLQLNMSHPGSCDSLNWLKGHYKRVWKFKVIYKLICKQHDNPNAYVEVHFDFDLMTSTSIGVIN